MSAISVDRENKSLSKKCNGSQENEEDIFHFDKQFRKWRRKNPISPTQTVKAPVHFYKRGPNSSSCYTKNPSLNKNWTRVM